MYSAYSLNLYFAVAIEVKNLHRALYWGVAGRKGQAHPIGVGFFPL